MTEFSEISPNQASLGFGTTKQSTSSPGIYALLAKNSSEFNQLCQTLTQQNRVYLQGYTLYCYSDELPENFRSQIVSLKIDVNYREAIHAHPKFISSTLETLRIDDNRELLTLRSQLAYLLFEYFGVDSLYFSLTEQVNDDQTYRNFWYQLYFNEIPCWSTPETLTFLKQELSNSPISGPLMISTPLLSGFSVPTWYSREIFRDIVELDNLLAQDQFQLIEGPVTGELYLCYRSAINLTEGRVDKLIDRIRQAIQNAIDLQIFPRNTPEQFIRTRALIPTEQGQWKLPSTNNHHNLSVFPEIYDEMFELKNIQQLGSFLMAVQQQSPEVAGRILYGLEFSISGRTISMRYRTRYLFDFIKVLELIRVEAVVSPKFQLRYPSTSGNNELQSLEDKLFFEFEDINQSTRGQIWIV